MDSRLRIAGQSVQQVLVMFPIGLLSMAVLFDLGNLHGAPAILGALAYWNVVAGLSCAVLAAAACAVDPLFVRYGRPAKRIGVLQGLANMGVLLLVAFILMRRIIHPDRVMGGVIFPVD